MAMAMQACTLPSCASPACFHPWPQQRQQTSRWHRGIAQPQRALAMPRPTPIESKGIKAAGLRPRAINEGTVALHAFDPCAAAEYSLPPSINSQSLNGRGQASSSSSTTTPFCSAGKGRIAKTTHTQQAQQRGAKLALHQSTS
ncbi:hypothetical protein SEVIR_5G276151v4 [Setaria viridis]